MMKIRRFLLNILFFIYPNLFSVLTNQEIKEILEYSNKMKKGFITEELTNIEKFLGNKKATTLFFEKNKLNKLNQDKWLSKEIRNNVLWHAQILGLLNSFSIENYNGLNLRGRNFILSSQSLFPSYFIKIPKYLLSQNNDKPFYYQNISRILYNKLIYECICNKQFKHIYHVKKCLIHIPDYPTELNDKNYALVVEKIESIYSYEQSFDIFKNLFKQAKNGVEEAIELIAEILYLIKNIGLWDIELRNIFFVEKYRVAFIDTEKWWYKEKDENFFHKDAEEIDVLSRHGIFLLSKLLCGVSTEKAIKLKNKLLLFKGNGNLVEELKKLLNFKKAF